MFYSKKAMRKYRFKKAIYFVGCAVFVAVAEAVLLYMFLNF